MDYVKKQSIQPSVNQLLRKTTCFTPFGPAVNWADLHSTAALFEKRECSDISF